MIAALLARFAPYKLALEIIVFGALAAFIVAGVHQFLEHERQMGRDEVQTRWDKQVAIDKEAAQKRERELQTQADKAQENATNREQIIRTLAASSASTSISLRDTITAIRNSLPAATSDAARNAASTYGDILAECEGRRREVAEEAERLNSEKRLLIEAFPKQ